MKLLNNNTSLYGYPITSLFNQSFINIDIIQQQQYSFNNRYSSGDFIPQNYIRVIVSDIEEAFVDETLAEDEDVLNSTGNNSSL